MVTSSDYHVDWRRTSDVIRERDGWICQSPNCKRDCSQNHSFLMVHHWDGDKQNNDPSNLISLCRDCHWEWHWGGKWEKDRILHYIKRGSVLIFHNRPATHYTLYDGATHSQVSALSVVRLWHEGYLETTECGYQYRMRQCQIG
jgi:hypothetical protein